MWVLVVDDSRIFRTIAMSALIQLGVSRHEILQAANGAEAIRILESYPVGLVLSDLVMEGVDGVELLRTMQRHAKWRDIPTVVISADGRQSRVRESIQLGAWAFIRKPCNRSDIVKRLERFIFSAMPLDSESPNGIGPMGMDRQSYRFSHRATAAHNALISSSPWLMSGTIESGPSQPASPAAPGAQIWNERQGLQTTLMDPIFQ